MIQPGQIVLFHFPRADLAEGKLRPALVLTQLPGEYDDWLVCMISSQTRHYVADFDEIIQEGDADFEPSGLKLTSVVRAGRFAVVEDKMLLGAVGQIAPERLQRIKDRLGTWISRS